MRSLREYVLRELLALEVPRLVKEFKSREKPVERARPPYVIRLDGVGFGKRLRDLGSPRDEKVHRALVEAAKELMKWFSSPYSYVSSDEINVLVLHDLYSSRTMKIVSISAGIASSRASLELGRALFFDSRVIELRSLDEAYHYMMLRMRICLGNLLTTLCRDLGCASERIEKKLEILRREGIVDRLEEWMLWGTCIYTENVVREATDRRSGVPIKVFRRRLAECSDPRVCLERVKGLYQF